MGHSKKTNETPHEAASAMGLKNRRGTLWIGSGAHFMHDGFADMLYLLLPVWQAEFALSLTQVGFLRTAYSGAMALLQLPAGMLAERWGERILLCSGTLITGLAYLSLGSSGGHLTLLFILLVGGAGSTVQHALCSSLISKAYEHGPRREALGVYNFAGDLGKVAVPFLVAMVISGFGWRWATTGVGVLGVSSGILTYLLLTALGAGARPAMATETQSTKNKPVLQTRDWGITDRSGFAALSAIGILDGAARSGFLTFLPFLLISKGAEVEAIGVALALTFAGGATGKFVCGFLAARLGIIRTVISTEALTCIGIAFVLPLPLYWTMALLPVIGMGLNGTSSVLYGTVSDFVHPERQARGFGLFYTLAIGGGASAPVLFGLLSDYSNVEVALKVVALVAFTTIPICKFLVKPLARAQKASA
jgi:FSR family fosmidomycin resistance protein-like MFS transporter